MPVNIGLLASKTYAVEQAISLLDTYMTLKNI